MCVPWRSSAPWGPSSRTRRGADLPPVADPRGTACSSRWPRLFHISFVGSDLLSTNTSVISHLKRLEAESIHIMREVAAEFANPVMLYSIGKDSSVMLHLAMKAFYPSKPPFPLMHVDTTWKFAEMIKFRDDTVKRLGLDLIVHVNEDGVKRGI